MRRAARRVRARFRIARREGVSPYYDLPAFCDHGPDHRTTKLHRYTACYLPELAARLIRKHSRPGDAVLDGFLGGGTTAIQAVANGRTALGVDIHPAAIEIAAARLAPVFPDALDRAITCIKRALSSREATRVRFPPEMYDWDWEAWFPRTSHARLSQLRRAIIDTRRADVRRLLLVATAGALKPVSYWYSHATKLQFDPTKKPQTVRDVMVPRLEQVRRINEELWRHVGGRAGAQRRRLSCALAVADCCALPFDPECADLAVSSPPYFIAYDYAKLLRLTSWWILGRVPEGTGHLESSGRGTDIDAKPPTRLGNIFARHFANAYRKLNEDRREHSDGHVRTFVRSLVPFFDGVRSALGEIHRVLRPGGKVCLVLGNTRHCGITVPTAEITTELALLRGFRLIAVHVRRQHSATQPQAHNELGQFTSDSSPDQYSYRDENVVVLQKP